MNDVMRIILYAYMGGFPIILGGLLSYYIQNHDFTMKGRVNHWFIAFAGGALISAISFALVPQAIESLSDIGLVIIFLSGTFTFMLIDKLISNVGGSFGIIISMLMDFLPEALALGASFAYSPNFGLLLAIFIGLQNFPEGYGSYIELTKFLSKKRTLLLMFGLSFVGIFSAVIGTVFLSNNQILIDEILLFAGGGILYLVFQDIAPLAKEANDWIPASGASIGFVIGMIGQKLLI